MKQETNFEEVVVKEYINLIARKGSKEFHSLYEYYLSKFYFLQQSRLVNEKEIERNFCIDCLKITREIGKRMNVPPKHGDDLIQHMSVMEFTYSVLFLIRKISKTISGAKTIPNTHKRIFPTDFAYNCFEHLRAIVSNDLADYSFIYRKMIKDKLIFESVGESEFRYFLDKNCEVSIGKMKQLYLCSTETKEQLYTTIKDSIS